MAKRKKRRNRNPFFMMVLIILCGGAGGFLFGILQDQTDFLNMAGKGGEGLLKYAAVLYMPMMFALIGIYLVFEFTAQRKIVSLERAEQCDCEDEEMDQLDRKIKICFELRSCVNMIYYTIVMVLFANCFYYQEGGIKELLVFLAGIVLCPIFVILQVQKQKKMDPRKKGTPMNKGFAKEWLESCDEAERQKIFQAGYYSHVFVMKAIVVVMGLMMVQAMFLESGMESVFAAALLLLLDIGANSYYSIKFQ
ncbi:MAG: DUF3169 family protein [Fusicatenibacter sp.]|nr:DUF3169 family protein [Fusicatenibacter sp.]